MNALINLRKQMLAAICMAALALPAVSQDLAADNMLLFQRNNGGWSKHLHEVAVNYNKQYSDADKATIAQEKSRLDATIDNNATTKEIRYLLKTYQTVPNREYLKAAQRGIAYLLEAQYANGGWPQYYPDKSIYRSEITYNDNAMINVMRLLSDIVKGKEEMALVKDQYGAAAQKATDKGVQCIINTQVKVNGKLTAWCAQYDAVTLQPAKARAFELISLSGAESVGIVNYLIDISNPSPEVKLAVNAAMDWFKTAAINGYKFEKITDATKPKGIDMVLVADANSTIWARFYDIETNQPFFTGRDGIKRDKVADVEYERRVGYAWYGNWPQKLFEKEYPKWKAKNG